MEEVDYEASQNEWDENKVSNAAGDSKVTRPRLATEKQEENTRTSIIYVNVDTYKIREIIKNKKEE